MAGLTSSERSRQCNEKQKLNPEKTLKEKDRWRKADQRKKTQSDITLLLAKKQLRSLHLRHPGMAWPKYLKQIHSKLTSFAYVTSYKGQRCFHLRPVAQLCKKPPDGVSHPPWRVLFLGTDSFALPHLQALNENRLKGDHSIIKTLDVVTSGKSPVLQYARREKLNMYKWPLPDLRGHYDLGVIVSFGHLIPDDVINMFPRGMLNVHPSLLPRWRGAAPIQHTILSGDGLTGICIIKIRPHKFDVGPILSKRTLRVPPGSTTTSLQTTLAEHGAEMLLDCLSDMDGLVPEEQERNKDKLTYARKLLLKHAYINWACTRYDIDHQFRALGDKLNLRSLWRGLHVRLLDMVPLAEMADNDIFQYLPPPDSGAIPEGAPLFMKHKGILAIKCKDGWVGFRRIMIRKSMSAKEFYNGYLSKQENASQLFVSDSNGLDKYFRKSRDSG